MSMKLINNEAVDFIFAVKRFADRNKPSENNFPKMKVLTDWCSEYEKKLSPFLLNDISLMFGRMILPSTYVFMLFAKQPGIDSAEKLLSMLNNVSTEDFTEFINKEFCGNSGDGITEEAIREVLTNEGLTPGYDPMEEASLMYGFLQDPGGFLKKLCSIYTEFYKQAYHPGHGALRQIEQEKYDWHSSKIHENGESYLELLGLHSFVKSISNSGEPVLYFSLFADNAISSFWSTRTVVIGAGTDERILHRSARDKADIFFSCFGDPKRLEILRLTAQRPWYSTELADHFNLKPATLSYHINILVDAELLNIEKGEARRFYYSLNRDSITEYLGYISQDLLGIDRGE